mmetsp:Transcript_23621/g.79937  ORF Transcript_23621/g.79937 Transcript_23621/m.79937 type:complete len:226 (-) Transcript_23621:14-691(-)
MKPLAEPPFFDWPMLHKSRTFCSVNPTSLCSNTSNATFDEVAGKVVKIGNCALSASTIILTVGRTLSKYVQSSAFWSNSCKKWELPLYKSAANRSTAPCTVFCNSRVVSSPGKRNHCRLAKSTSRKLTAFNLAISLHNLSFSFPLRVANSDLKCTSEAPELFSMFALASSMPSSEGEGVRALSGMSEHVVGSDDEPGKRPGTTTTYLSTHATRSHSRMPNVRPTH